MTRDGRFRWASVIVSVLLLAALLLGWQHQNDVRRQHEQARRHTRQDWLTQGRKNPHSAAHYGVYAFKPTMPLSWVDRGVDPWVGVASWLEAHHQNDFQYRQAQDSTAVQRFGELTGATVLQLLLPLVIVLLTFGAFSDERERGTLRQLLSLGLRRPDLALGKALGVAGALGFLIVPATLAGVLALALSEQNGALLADGGRILGMTSSYLLYFVAFLGVSLAVSAKAPSSRAALLTLLAFWIVNGLVAPRAAADLARLVYPAPSAFEFANKMDAAMKHGIHGDETPEQRAAALREEVLRRYNVSRLEDLPVDFGGIRLQAGEEHANTIFDHFYSDLWTTFRRQETVHRTLAAFAPVLAVRSLSMGFAGTDFTQHTHFAKAAEEYRREIQRLMNGDLAEHGKTVQGPYLQDEALWSKVPEFTYEAPDAGWVLSHQASSLVLLAAWAAAAAAAAWRAAATQRVD